MQRWQIEKLFDERINYLGKCGMSLQLQGGRSCQTKAGWDHSKATKGSKAKGNGKGMKAPMMNTHPQEPCYRCTETGHYPAWRPSKNETCTNCGKGGHLAKACTATVHAPPKATVSACHCCGTEGHKKADCPQKAHVCLTCKKSGHMEHLCHHKDKDQKNAAAKDAGKVTHAGPCTTWMCITCGPDGKPLYLDDKSERCPK